MRGQQSRHYISCHCLRIIPARAGPTRRATGRSATGPDPSPLVRGQRRQGRGPGARGRIIPARAGPTTARARPRCARTDHPRSCGANAYYQSRSAHQSGSSPLVRGQRRFYHSTQLYGRIIPARAGPTSPCPLYRPQAPDHPRSCGANAIAGVYDKIHLGSSPLVRGQRTGQSAFQRCVRIIPARAGPTSCPSGSSGNRPDHPRSCGANPSGIRSNADLAGSSPLVRGQHASRLVGLSRVRIIPARAGPTSSLYSSSSTSQDHPRSCGANCSAVLPVRWASGSSPLVRGQLP